MWLKEIDLLSPLGALLNHYPKNLHRSPGYEKQKINNHTDLLFNTAARTIELSMKL